MERPTLLLPNTIVLWVWTRRFALVRLCVGRCCVVSCLCGLLLLSGPAAAGATFSNRTVPGTRTNRVRIRTLARMLSRDIGSEGAEPKRRPGRICLMSALLLVGFDPLWRGPACRPALEMLAPPRVSAVEER